MINVYQYPDTWDVHFAREICLSLNRRDIPFTLKHKDKFFRSGLNPYSAGLKRCVVVERNESFWIINHHDRIDSYECIMKTYGRLPRFGGISQCQYRGNTTIRHIQPYTYLEKNPPEFRKISDGLIDTWKKEEKLYFRGDFKAHDGRQKRLPVLKGLADILNMDWPNTAPFEKHLRNIAEHKLCLSIPGNGDFCHREIECFGLRAAVLMPNKLNQFAHDLKPDFHYVGVNVDWEKDEADVIATAIRRRYEEVIKDPHYLQWIAYNGYLWYQSNVLTPGPGDLFLDTWDING